LAVPVNAEQRSVAAQSGQSPAAWVANRAGIARETAFTRSVGLAKDSTEPLAADAKLGPKPPYGSDTGELSFDKDAKLLLLTAPAAAGIFGFIGKSAATAGPLDVQLGPSARGFAAVLLTARD